MTPNPGMLGLEA